MKSYLIPAILAFYCSGCTLLDNLQGNNTTTQSAPVEVPPMSDDRTSADTPFGQDYTVYSPVNHNKALNDYARQIVMELTPRARFDAPIAIASFVEFDESLRNTNSLGNQLAEAVAVEMSAQGYPVAEINATGRIEQQANGNFALSRSGEGKAANICCIVAGSLIYEQRGVRVNTKLFDRADQRILAATSVIIPYFIARDYGAVASR